MTEFKIHDIDSAPNDAKPLLEKSKAAFGRIPNLHGVMAESPQHLEAYQTLHALFEQTSLSVEERNVVWMAINVHHACHYCVPAHTTIAKSQGVREAVIDALRSGAPLPDDKLEALRTFTIALTEKRGEVSQADLDAFYAAGYGDRQVLDITLGLAQKVLSNYTNHMAQTPLDDFAKPYAWSPAEAAE